MVLFCVCFFHSALYIWGSSILYMVVDWLLLYSILLCGYHIKKSILHWWVLAVAFFFFFLPFISSAVHISLGHVYLEGEFLDHWSVQCLVLELSVFPHYLPQFSFPLAVYERSSYSTFLKTWFSIFPSFSFKLFWCVCCHLMMF